MQDVGRIAVQNVQHVFECALARLVGLRILGGQQLVIGHLMQRGALDDLVWGGIRQDHQGDLVRDLRKALGHVRVRPPGGNGIVDRLAVFAAIFDLVLFAGPLECVADDLLLGSPCAHRLVQTITTEAEEKGVQFRLGHLAGVDLRRGTRHVVVGQGAVAIKRDEFRCEARHLGSSFAVIRD